MSPNVSAIVVTHNSEQCLELCLQHLVTQDHSFSEIILVDSGSADTSYLTNLAGKFSFQLLLVDNIGFSRANNLGVENIASRNDFILFVNPDVFLPPDFVSKALQLCSKDLEIGMLSGKLLGYNLEKEKPGGKIDSTGIERKWYGRWYDRGQGEEDKQQYDRPECMLALCGALLFCRKNALLSLGDMVFDPGFFLYKEDIELSLRMRKKGWRILYHPELQAYHCRGWNSDRRSVRLRLRKIAARSEILLYKKHPSPYILWALFKYFLVTFFHL